MAELCCKLKGTIKSFKYLYIVALNVCGMFEIKKNKFKKSVLLQDLFFYY